VGDLLLDVEGIAVKGLLVRHMVLPNGLADSAEIVRFLSEEISRNTYLNIMAQYRPEYRACDYTELDRRITAKEYADVIRLAADAGLTRGLELQ
jgi:putative pyruvate formate lyase activating enzyme